MDRMLFYSTNHTAPEVGLKEALFTGQAPDKGLYMPREIPRIYPDQIEGQRGAGYPQVAHFILEKFTASSMDSGTLRRLCEDAYDYDVPLEEVSRNRYVMRLDRGPTASFKDFAARMMARLFGEFMKGRDGELVILTATSGDTGSAIAHAFYNIPNIKVMVLFPEKEVSNRQRKQMTTLGGNILVASVDGKFDDCQHLVKTAFADDELKDIRLTSANSINIGRLLPQIVYYFYAYIRLAGKGKKITFSVPSGNFGNMMGALLAMRMGLPVDRLVIATNENDEVPVYLKTEEYNKIVPSRVCISNAMNVGHPSNFARVVDLFGGHMDETGVIHREPDIKSIRKSLWTASITDSETRETIRNAWKDRKLLLEPHGAVAWAAAEKYARETGLKELMVSVETAHPAKFPEEIESLLSFAPEIPPSLSSIEHKKEDYIDMPNDYDEFRRIIKRRFSR